MELFTDLGASVTFVAEQPEDDVMSCEPRDPRQPFMDREMQFGIVAGGLSLGAAVLVGYLATWAHGANTVQAQTAAVAVWMIGHVVLAANMRAERQPLLRTNPLSNRPFLIWAATAGWIGDRRNHAARVADTVALHNSRSDSVAVRGDCSVAPTFLGGSHGNGFGVTGTQPLLH